MRSTGDWVKKALVFFPQNPYPPRAGNHKRCLEILSGLREFGAAVTLLSANAMSQHPWDAASMQGLKEDLVDQIFLYEKHPLDILFFRLVRKYYHLRRQTPPWNTISNTPPMMCHWFSKMVKQISPDIIIMNYAYFDRLLNHRRCRRAVTIMETHDLLTLNEQMRSALQSYLPQPPMDPVMVNDQVLREDFYDALGLTARPEEFRIYNKYDYTVAITEREAALIKDRTKKTRVLHIPMTQDPIYVSNDYSGPALLPTGPNVFNVQGYLYFAKRVLPLVRQRLPDFNLQVTGYCSEIVSPEDGVTLSSFVPDLKPVYEAARFVVCPVFGGTGQQVKIVEAMAHGVPVVALQAPALRSPMVHGINGLVADNAEQFAEHVIQLWTNPGLCRQLGHAARQTIERESSKHYVSEAISSVLSSRQAAQGVRR